MENTEKKYKELILYIKKLVRAAVAFSGGVDSTLLLLACKEALDENVIALTACADWFPERELEEAAELCKELGITHRLINIKESEIDGFCENPPDRCYHCKKAIFTRFISESLSLGIEHVCDGTNADDEGDYRPGIKALNELKIISPLKAVGLTKAEIRQLLKEKDVPSFDKPSFACLASRFVYGETITSEKLRMVEKAEQLLFELGFKQFRVRVHSNLARIEVLPDDIERISSSEIRVLIVDKLKALGFLYVTVDLGGFKSGSMNLTLQ